MPDVIAAHKHSSQHRAELSRSSQCGCFHCLARFEPSEILDWVDWPKGTPESGQLDSGTTALCPVCGIDSVIGSI
ncbi:cytoplasmic protein [Pseudoduganella albidiflava]|uniref:Cytoplasmic protein n=1 Tax=Pseudoduganella albidiflava TaxID=321983 RepID=A0ABX5RRQ1_9BURK|nr:cytoplasmic protein [Pseudoduganella albidiflava]